MKSYFGYDKPYIYVYCPTENEEIMVQTLTPLREKGVLFCRNGQASRKELRRVEAAHAVMLFVTRDCIQSEDFHRVVNRAVQSGKNILTVYLEDVILDNWSHMQLDSAQALFCHQLSDEEFARKLTEAAIFRNMAVTKQQKQFQKRRGFSLVAIPVLAAILLFTTVVYPLMLAPEKETEGGIPGLKGLTQAELDQITELHICGDQVYTDMTKVHCWYINGRTEIGVELENWNTGFHTTDTTATRGPITDLSDLTKLRNLEVLEISAQQITDLTPVWQLTKLRRLGVECNPITSLEGIENLQNLEQLWLSGTDVSDLTPLEALPRLSALGIDGTYVRDLPNVETLERIESFCASSSGVRMSYVGEHENYGLDLRGLSYQLRDFSFLRDVKSFNHIFCNDVYLSDFMPVLLDKPIESFAISNIYGLTEITQLDGLMIKRVLDVCHTGSLVSIEGIEMFDGVEEICLKDCLGLTDLTPLNNLQNVQLLRISSDMRGLAETQLNTDVCFSIRYEDD